MNTKSLYRYISVGFVGGENGSIFLKDNWRIFRAWSREAARSVYSFLTGLAAQISWRADRSEGRSDLRRSVARSSRPYGRPQSDPARGAVVILPSGGMRCRSDGLLEEIDREFQFVDVTALPSVTRRNRLLVLFSARTSDEVRLNRFCRRYYLYYN